MENQRPPLFLKALLLLSLAVTAKAGAESGSGELVLRQDQFISSDFEATNQKNFSYLGANLNNTESSPGLRMKNGFPLPESKENQNGALKAEISGQFSPSDSVMNYVNFSQLYWQDGDLAAGRKKKMWSRLDRTWGLGLFEPNFKWNPTQPEAQGLTGVFLDLGDSSREWKVSLFASFLYIPDQGTNYELRDGNFERANPWFQSPPSFVRFLGQTDRVNYDIQKPETNDIIFNRSYAGSFHVGHEDQGFAFQTAMASKPSNQLALGFRGYLTPNNVAQVQVEPRIYYHNLLAAELAYGQKNWTLGVGALGESPEAPHFDPDITYVQYRPSSVVSPFVQIKNSLGYLALSYLKVQGGEGEVKGALGTSQNSILPDRYPYREAAQLSGALTKKLKRQQLIEFSASYLQGAGNDFSILNLQAGYKWDPYWKATLGGQLIAASDSDSAAKTVAGQFQNNDTLGVGVVYVF